LADVCIGALPIAVGLGIVGGTTKNHLATSAALCAGMPNAGLALVLLITAAIGRRPRAG